MAPNHSWKNPVESVMLLLNIGLQCVGLMRAKLLDAWISVSNLQYKQFTPTERSFFFKKRSCVILEASYWLAVKHFHTFGIKRASFWFVWSHYWGWNSLIVVSAATDWLSSLKLYYHQETLKLKQQCVNLLSTVARLGIILFSNQKMWTIFMCQICKPVCLDSNVFETSSLISSRSNSQKWWPL